MRRVDPAPVLTVEDRVDGDQRTVLEDADLSLRRFWASSTRFRVVSGML
jgi:hypothetical protein